MPCTLLLSSTRDTLPGDSLERLLRRATPLPSPGRREALLCLRFGLAPPWPLAELARCGDDLGSLPGHWLHADPVHLLANLEQVRLLPVDDLTDTEAAALLDTLNQHFAEDGLRFHAPAPTRFYLQLAEPPRITTTPLREVAGQDITASQPEGDDRRLWLRRLTEAQMLLHAHPVNAAREARGVRTANALWLWGEGPPPSRLQNEPVQVWCDDPLLRGLARLANLAPQPPVDAAAVLAGTGNRLVALPGGLDAARLERDWFAPLARALGSPRLDRLELWLDTPSGLRGWLARPGDRWAFWRRRQTQRP